MELTQAQNDYIFTLTEEWNRCMGEKRPIDFIKDDVSMAIVTSMASMINTMFDNRPEVEASKTWGFILLGAFLHDEGLLRIDKGILQ